MKIRAATVEDVEAIHQLGMQVEAFTVNDETVTFWPKELLRNTVQSDNALVYVAEDEGIVGFVIANYNPAFKKALIENIYVRPDKRGQGVGNELLKELLKGLVAMDCAYVATLVPLDSQEAISLYESAGFSQGEVFQWLDKPLHDTFKQEQAA